MSAFMHNDRYKLRDGTVREQVVGKYNCYQTSQKLRKCTGQQLYKADIVDAIVLDVVRKIFREFKAKPRDRTVENRITQTMTEEKAKRHAMEKKIEAAQHNLECYENEVIKVIDGTGRFSAEMLSRMIDKAEQELNALKVEYAHMVASAKDKASQLKMLEQYYNEFLGWTNEFETATLERRRMILCQLINRVEIGTKYKVDVKLNMSYGQLLEMTQPKKIGMEGEVA